MSKRTYFANIYPEFIGSVGHVYSTREQAEQMKAYGRLACVPFEVETPEDSTDVERPST